MLFPLLSKFLFEKFIYIQYFWKRGFISFIIRLERKKKVDGFIVDVSIAEVLKPFLSSPPCCSVKGA